MSRNLSLNGKQGEPPPKKLPQNTCAQNKLQKKKKKFNNTLNTKGKTDGQTLGRLKRIIIVALI